MLYAYLVFIFEFTFPLKKNSPRKLLDFPEVERGIFHFRLVTAGHLQKSNLILLFSGFPFLHVCQSKDGCRWCASCEAAFLSLNAEFERNRYVFHIVFQFLCKASKNYLPPTETQIMLTRPDISVQCLLEEITQIIS